MPHNDSDIDFGSIKKPVQFRATLWDYKTWERRIERVPKGHILSLSYKIKFTINLCSAKKSKK